MEISAVNKILIDIKFDFNSSISNDSKEAIINKVLDGLENKLEVFYKVVKLINKVNLVKAEFKLKTGAQSMMLDAKTVVDEAISEALGEDKELVKYTLNVETE